MGNVTKEDVFIAADLLAAEAIMPSILGVRKLLGDKGSESTLQKYLKEWKKNLLLNVATYQSNEMVRENDKLRVVIAEIYNNLKKSLEELQKINC
jgi:hypothetical protein